MRTELRHLSRLLSRGRGGTLVVAYSLLAIIFPWFFVQKTSAVGVFFRPFLVLWTPAIDDDVGKDAKQPERNHIGVAAFLAPQGAPSRRFFLSRSPCSCPNMIQSHDRFAEALRLLWRGPPSFA